MTVAVPAVRRCPLPAGCCSISAGPISPSCTGRSIRPWSRPTCRRASSRRHRRRHLRRADPVPHAQRRTRPRPRRRPISVTSSRPTCGSTASMPPVITASSSAASRPAGWSPCSPLDGATDCRTCGRGCGSDATATPGPGRAAALAGPRPEHAHRVRVGAPAAAPTPLDIWLTARWGLHHRGRRARDLDPERARSVAAAIGGVLEVSRRPAGCGRVRRQRRAAGARPVQLRRTDRLRLAAADLGVRPALDRRGP